MPLNDDDHDRAARQRAARRREVNTGVHWRPGPAAAWTVTLGDVIPPVEPGAGERGAPD